MTRTLRTYQRTAADFVISNPRCNLFLAMGLGKTATVLNALDELSLVEDVYPVLVVAPLRVAKSVWPEEISLWANLQHIRVSVVCGTAAERKSAMDRDADIYCINFDNLEWMAKELGDEWTFKTLVVDECSKLKGFRLRQGTKRAAALSKYAHKTPRYVGLTGTPCSNSLTGLWALTWFLDQGQRLGRTYSGFQNRWFHLSYNGFDLVPLPTAQSEIESRIKDLCLSIDPKDHFDLREPIVNHIGVTLPTKAMNIYKQMETQMYVELEGLGIEAMNAAVKTMKCLQLANGALYTDEHGNWSDVHDAKLDALESVIEEANGMPVLVAYHFKSDLARMQSRIKNGKHLDSNEQTIKDWNEGKIPVLFAHPASAGHGLSLQHGSNILCFFSVNWNLEEHLQIIERIGPTRQAQSGYDRPVYIHYILANNTIDSIVMERIRTKRSVQDILLDAMKKHHQK